MNCWYVVEGSYETQTFIDGMHVLNPYTSNGINTPARSRYSTFMFSGVNLVSEALHKSMEKRFRQSCHWKQKITARSIKSE